MESTNACQPSSDTMIVRSLFGHSIDTVINSYACSYRRQSGRLYIAPNSLCYYSNIFGFERKIMIRIEDVKYASLIRTTSIVLRSQCADGVNESRDTLEEHTFRSFNDRQQVLRIILDAYKRVVGKKFSNENCPPDALILKRDDANTFTTPLQKIIKRSQGAEMEVNDNGIQPVFSGLDTIINEDGTSNGQDALDMGNDNEKVSTRIPRRRAHTSESVALHSLGQPRWPRRRARTDESLSSCSLGNDNVKNKRDIQREWNNTKNKFEQSYNEIVVESRTIPISLMDYYNKFIVDGAPHSMPTFQETIVKDENVQFSPWDPKNSSMEEDDYIECNRTMTYIHKRKARFGPSSVPVEKKQVCRKYARYGIVLNQTLKTEGIPYSFEVQDEWIIEARGDHVVISVRFRMHFNEKPPIAFIKKTIISASRKGVSSWFELYLDMVNSTVRGGDNKLSGVNGGTPRTNLFRFDFDGYEYWFNGINCFVICVSIIMVYVFSLHRRVQTLETEVHRLELMNENIMHLLDQAFLEK